MDTSKWEVGGSREASTKRLNLSWWGLILQHLLDVRLDSHKTNREQFAPENKAKMAPKRTCIIWINHWFSGLKLVLSFREVSPLSTNFRCFFSAVEFHHVIPPLESQPKSIGTSPGGSCRWNSIPLHGISARKSNSRPKKTVSMLKIQIGQWKKNTLVV